MSLAHLTLATRNVRKAAAFFTGVLGWRPIPRPNNIGRAAAWLEIARRGKGIEMAHFQIVHTGVTLAVCSRLRPTGSSRSSLVSATRGRLRESFLPPNYSGPRLRPGAASRRAGNGGPSGAASLSPPHPHVH